MGQVMERGNLLKMSPIPRWVGLHRCDFCEAIVDLGESQTIYETDGVGYIVCPSCHLPKIREGEKGVYRYNNYHSREWVRSRKRRTIRTGPLSRLTGTAKARRRMKVYPALGVIAVIAFVVIFATIHPIDIAIMLSLIVIAAGIMPVMMVEDK